MSLPTRTPPRPCARHTVAAGVGSVLVLLAAVVVATPALAQHAVPFLELEERLVQGQLEVELTDYRAARSREEEARGRVTETAGALDQALSEGASADRIAALEADLDSARGTEAVAAAAVDSLLERIVERRLRLQLVREELRRRRGGPADLPDPLTGTWRLTLEGSGADRSGERRGLLDLELQATEVHGTLGLQDGTFGSVRGTFVRGDLKLERVSADSGLDLILEGTYDPGDGALEGTWHPAVAGLGNPGGGSWRAVRAEPAQNQ